jgi:hypothetical protein
MAQKLAIWPVEPIRDGLLLGQAIKISTVALHYLCILVSKISVSDASYLSALAAWCCCELRQVIFQFYNS